MSVTLSDLETAVWFKTPDGKLCIAGNVRLYCSLAGHWSAAENEIAIAAVFVSLEAALSWSDDWDAAERAFKAMNPPTGKGENYLPPKHDQEGRSHE